jgi:23S rRNA (pseudouridine1915-N3)-methyltransferase
MPLRMTVLCLGRRDDHLEAVVEDLRRLIRPYAQIDVLCVRPPGRQDGTAASLAAEGRALRRHWTAGSRAVVLSPEGKSLDTPAFAKWLALRRAEGRPVLFTIGGAYGLDAGLKAEGSDLLSLSALTLSHRVALLVLLEQLYRGFTILDGHPYHK